MVSTRGDPLPASTVIPLLSAERAALVHRRNASPLQSLWQALDAVKVRGTVVIVGVSHKLTVNPWEQLICREVTVLGTRSFNTAEYDEMIALVRRRLPVEQAVTHRFPLTQAEAAFDLFRSGQCGKILLTG